MGLVLSGMWDVKNLWAGWGEWAGWAMCRD